MTSFDTSTHFDLFAYIQSAKVSGQRAFCRYPTSSDALANFFKQLQCSSIEDELSQSTASWHVLADPKLDLSATLSNSKFNLIDSARGQQLLGQESQVLVVTRHDLNPDSFNAACGTLIAGGVLIMLELEDMLDVKPHSQVWLEQALIGWPLLELNSLQRAKGDAAQHLRPKPSCSAWKSLNSQVGEVLVTRDQALAAQAIEKVLSGHRKRPLVLQASRGRGKSAILGIGAAEIACNKKTNIIITTAKFSAISGVFEHFKHVCQTKNIGCMQQSKQTLCLANGSQLSFIAPDAVMQAYPACDLFIVDEAASLPISFLKAFTHNYHRLIFSTTTHGYEGCGRGFSLKFLPWLHQQRQVQEVWLEQAIRWSKDDPLENWLFETFLFNAAKLHLNQPQNIKILPSELSFKMLKASDLLSERALAEQVFQLLISAHYQTSANDLWQMLDDPAMKIFIAKAKRSNSPVLGCILGVEEGGLNPELAMDICLGKRRPRGHLAPALLANQLGLPEIASQSCLRVMRIAVDISYQGQGIGTWMLRMLTQSQKMYDFIATSFGVTQALVHFWKTEFDLAYLGTSRDKASGTYSAVWVRPNTNTAEIWLKSAQESCFGLLAAQAALLWQDMDRASYIALIQALAPQINMPTSYQLKKLSFYAQGGSCFESICHDAQQCVAFVVSRGQCIDVIHIELLVAAFMLKADFPQLAVEFKLVGRKQVEQALRTELALLLQNLQCKSV